LMLLTSWLEMVRRAIHTTQISPRRGKGARRSIAMHSVEIQTLERRYLLTTNAWVSATSGDFFDGANWSLGHAPTSTEDVSITVAGTYTVTANGVANIKSLTLGTTTGAESLVTSGELKIAAASTIASNGSLTSIGTLDGAGSLTNQGTLTLQY